MFVSTHTRFNFVEPFEESPDVIVADANESDISETTSIFSDNKDLAARDPFDSDDMNESKKEQVQDDLDAAVISDKLQKRFNFTCTSWGQNDQPPALWPLAMHHGIVRGRKFEK